MNGMVTKFVECMRDGKLIASYKLGYGTTLVPTPPPDLIAAAKSNLIREGLVKPPFDFTGIEFQIRSAP